MEQRNGSRPKQARPNSMAILIAATVLGLSVIIAGVSVSSAVKKLTEAVTAQTFSSTLNAPSNINVKSVAEKRYFNEEEAAAYLNMTADEIRAAITKKEIEEYVKTSAGYSISKETLDAFFDKKAYDTLNSNNKDDSAE